jgi:hypothetical protein
MAKRFFDTNKFSDEWYRKLPVKYKLFWDYLLCVCDNAGVFKLDIELASYFIGEPLINHEIESLFQGRLYPLGGVKYFIPKFIHFQYGELGDSKPHQAVKKRLASEGINLQVVNDSVASDTLSIEYRESPRTLKEKEKNKDKDQDQDKEKAKDQETSPMLFLFPNDEPIKLWLNAGDYKIQKEILNSNSHHVLVEEIRKAFIWQYSKEKRRADGFLYTWLKNVNNKGFGLINRQSTNGNKSETGNPYKKQLEEMRKNKAVNE